MTHIIQPKFEPAGYLALLAEHRVAMSYVVPAMALRLLDEPIPNHPADARIQSPGAELYGATGPFLHHTLDSVSVGGALSHAQQNVERRRRQWAGALAFGWRHSESCSSRVVTNYRWSIIDGR